MTDIAKPSPAERFFFDTNGYLLLENLLTPEHTAALREATLRLEARRRAQLAQDPEGTEGTWIEGDNTHLYYLIHEDPLFLDLLDHPAIWPYVTGLLNERPHYHASNAYIEYGTKGHPLRWHQDGFDEGYRNLGWPVPLMQLKVGYYLTDMTEPGQNNLCIVPGSHKSRLDPDPDDLLRPDLFPGVRQICAPAGSAILFHNALWHSIGPWTKDSGGRIILYYAYEHPWMMASRSHWWYRPEFYNSLSAERRKLFHGFLFDPPEPRWG
jgi:ectoine hydroxylase-related dioxygenase (phytanoyl-CoA dioxygenase family)